MIRIEDMGLKIDKETIVTVVKVGDGKVTLCDGANVVSVETSMKLKVGTLLKLNDKGTALIVAKSASTKADDSKNKLNPPKDAFSGYNAL